MLLVHPLETLIRFLPALLAVVIFRAGSEDNDRWELYAVPLIVAFGVLRWVTTRYRIADGQIELRRGLFTKQTTTARLDKVRTIDLTARVYHRLLGLAKVEVSTAGGQPRPARPRLAGRRRRATAARRAAPPPRPRRDRPSRADRRARGGRRGARATSRPRPTTSAAPARPQPGSATPRYGHRTRERRRDRRLRDAGLLALLAGAVRLPRRRLDGVAAAWWADVLLLLGVVSLLAVGAYVLTFWGFRLTRNRLGTLHTRRGLLTNRETSIDAARVRGIRLDEPSASGSPAPAGSRSSPRASCASRAAPTGCARPRRPTSSRHSPCASGPTRPPCRDRSRRTARPPGGAG